MSTTTTPTYTVGPRERVAWIRDGVNGRVLISHPYVVTVSEDGVPVKMCDTRREALAWIAAQY